MATGPEHYRRAEELLARDGPLTGEVLATAQVHATLALAAATALVGGGSRLTHGVRWREPGLRTCRRSRLASPGVRGPTRRSCEAAGEVMTVGH